MKQYYDLQHAVVDNDNFVFEPQMPKLKLIFVAMSNGILDPTSERRVKVITNFISFCKKNNLKYTDNHIKKLLNTPPDDYVCYIKQKHTTRIVREGEPDFKMEYAIAGYSLLLEYNHED